VPYATASPRDAREGAATDEIGEADLLAGGAAGRVVECGSAGAKRRVDAGLVRRCCHELKDQIDPRGIRLRNAHVAGVLDLAGLEVPFPLLFEGCEFDSPLVAEGAQLSGLSVTGTSRLPGLLANGVRIRRDLDLSGTHVTGTHKTSASTSKWAAVWLCESAVGGRVLCVDTVIDGGGDRSIQADRLQVSGNIRLLHRFTARGEIRLIGARISGSLDLTGARIEATTTGLALDLGEAVIEGSVFVIEDTAGRRPFIGGRIDMGRAQIGGQFLLRGATLEAHQAMPVSGAYARARGAGTALSAPRLSVDAEMTLEEGCQVFGGMDLAMSELSSLSIESGCALHAPGRTALDLTNSEIRALLRFDHNATIQGTMRLAGATIHGTLALHGQISHPAHRSVIGGSAMTVDGDVYLDDLRTDGGRVTFRNATLGSFGAPHAQLHNPSDYSLNLTQAVVKGSVFLDDGFTSTGLVALNRSTIDGRLKFTGGSFNCPAATPANEHGHAIELISATIRGGIDLGWNTVSPSVDFTNATTAFLADNPANWPTQFTISGFTYDRFEQPQRGGAGQTWDHKARSAWLNRQATFDSGPYEQAARVFRQHGYTDGAKAILIAQRRNARQVITGRWAVPRRARDAAYDLTVRYGYRPGRVLWLLLFLLILVTVSLEIPTARASMRATTAAGTVYSVRGPLRPKALTHTTTADAAATGSAARPADACGNGQVRCFNPVLYAFDTVIPLVSLDQRSTWYPDAHAPGGTFMQWWLNAATVLGWLLSSIFVLALASLARST